MLYNASKCLLDLHLWPQIGQVNLVVLRVDRNLFLLNFFIVYTALFSFRNDGRFAEQIVFRVSYLLHYFKRMGIDPAYVEDFFIDIIFWVLREVELHPSVQNREQF